MTLAEDVNLDEFVMAKDELSGADIKVTFFKLKFLLFFLMPNPLNLRLFALKLVCSHFVRGE